MKKVLGLLVLAGAAASANADYTFAPFNLTNLAVNNSWNNNGAIALTGAPSAPYIGYRVNFAWNSTPPGTSNSHAWSNEANIAFASASATGSSSSPTYPIGTVVHSASTTASNGAGNATSVPSLNFAGSFSTVYGGGANPLFFNYRQSFASTINNVNWNNISITLVEAVRPTCINLGGISGASLNFNTIGSTGTSDTEIGVFNDQGQLLGQDDDSGPDSLSSLNLAALPNGVYYIAVGAFNTAFSNGWLATTTGPAIANVTVNVTNGTDTLTGGGTALGAGQIAWYCITVPTPGALALVGVGGLVASRRRRA